MTVLAVSCLGDIIGNAIVQVVVMAYPDRFSAEDRRFPANTNYSRVTSQGVAKSTVSLVHSVEEGTGL